MSKDVILLKRCQISKNQTPGLWRRFTIKINCHNEVQFWCNLWWSQTSEMSIKLIFDQFWWPLCVTSKLTSISVNLIMLINFFVNFLHSSDVWIFNIFWQLDIFLTTWYYLTYFWQHDIFLTFFDTSAHDRAIFWHICNNLEVTWDSLIWSRISP